MKQDRAAAAALQFEETLRLEPTNNKAREYLLQVQAPGSRKP